MIESKDIDALMGADVVDDDDDRIGKVSQVYVDSQDQHPSWVAVKTGFFGSAETLVPIDDASWDSARLHVGVSKDKVKEAPHVDPDREITVDEQNDLYRHYGIAASVDHEPAAARDDDGDAGAADAGAADDAPQGRHVAAGDDRASDADADADADVQRDAAAGTVVSDAGSYSVEDATPTADATPGEPARQDTNPPVDAAGTDTDGGEAVDTVAAADGSAHAAPAPYSDAEHVAEASTPSVAPERGDDRAASGSAAGAGYRMRLRKITVTEQRTVTVTVPVTHEEIRLERVPDDEPDGPDVIDGEADVVLMAERPVVSTEQVAAEHVHVAVDRLDDASRAG